MANRIWKEYDFLIFHSQIIHCGLLQSSAAVDLLPYRWFHYLEIIVITIKSPFINCHINYPPCCLLIWNLLSSRSPGAHFIMSMSLESSLESCKRWTWLLWHTDLLPVLLLRCLLIVQSPGGFGTAPVCSSCDSWFCWYWLAICHCYFYFPPSPLWFPHFFFFTFFFLVLSFHLPVQLFILFSFLSSKLPFLGYLPSCTFPSYGITFSVFLLCHLQVSKASLPFPHIRHWYLIFPFFASTLCFLVTICVSHLLLRVLSPSSFLTLWEPYSYSLHQFLPDYLWYKAQTKHTYSVNI